MNRRRPPAKSQHNVSKSQFRIISGQWRGRKLAFPTVEGLRPTPDRVRETLFNWLSDELHDARCLDLFAGSGALGLECLSRGAQRCTFIDGNRAATQAINGHLQQLQAQGQALTGSLPSTLNQLSGKTFEMIFIDPPYAEAGLINDCLAALEAQHCIHENAWIYIENSSSDQSLAIPERFEIYRQKIFGQVQSTLLRYVAPLNKSI